MSVIVKTKFPKEKLKAVLALSDAVINSHVLLFKIIKIKFTYLPPVWGEKSLDTFCTPDCGREDPSGFTL